MIHLAQCIPGKRRHTRFGAAVGQLISAVLRDLLVAIDAERGRGDDGGLHILRRIRREEQLLHFHRGLAGRAQTCVLLEELDRILRAFSEVAVQLAGIIAQLLQSALQVGDAAVFVAADEENIPVVFRRARCEQALLHRGCRVSGNVQTRLRLELLDSFLGFLRVGVARRSVEIVQRLQAFVQFTHAIAAVAQAKIDIAGTGVCILAVQRHQRLARRAFGNGNAVFLLEQLHRLLRARSENAVRRIREIAQIAQALLHGLHAQSAVAAAERAIGIILCEIAAQNLLLQIGVRYAGHLQPQIALQQANRALRAPAENAVDVIVVVAQIVQRLLNVADRRAAAAALKRGVRFGRFEKRPRGNFVCQCVFLNQNPRFVAGCIHIGGEFHECKRRRFGRARHICIHVYLSAHRLDGIRIHLLIARKRRRLNRCKLGKVAAVGIHGIDHAIRRKHEQMAGRRRNLLFKRHARRGQHFPLHFRRIVALQAHGAAGVGKIIDLSVHDCKIVHIGIHEIRFGIARTECVQVASVGEIDLIVVDHRALGRIVAVVRLKQTGRAVEHHRARIVDERYNQTFRRIVQAVQLLRRYVRNARATGFKIHAHQLRAIGIVDVIENLGIDHAGGANVARDGCLGHRGQIQANQRSLFNAVRFRLAQENQPIRVDCNNLIGARRIHRLIVSRNVQFPIAVDIGGQGLIPHNRIAAPVRAVRPCGACGKRNQHCNQQRENPLLHRKAPPFHFFVPLRRNSFTSCSAFPQKSVFRENGRPALRRKGSHSSL